MNEAQDRKKRPPAQRTEPDRSLSGSRRHAQAPRDDGAPDEQGARQAEAADPREVGYQAINDAYRLIDEYMRQGQKFAEGLWLPPEGGDGAFAAPTRFMRAMGDMTMAWVDVVQQWTNGQSPPQPSGTAGPFAVGSARAPHQRQNGTGVGPEPAPHWRLSVQGKGRIEVEIDVGEPTGLCALVPSELRPMAGEAPPIREVSLQSEATGPPLLRIVVPDDQPAGTYNGLLVEAGTHRPRGTISVIVS